MLENFFRTVEPYLLSLIFRNITNQLLCKCSIALELTHFALKNEEMFPWFIL